MKRKVLWLVALWLLALAVTAMWVVENRGQTLVPRAYLPVVQREYGPSIPTATPTATPIATSTPTLTPTITATSTSTSMPTPTATATPMPCALVVYWHMDDDFSGFCYEVQDTGIGQICLTWSTAQYGAFPSGMHTWCAEWWPWWHHGEGPYKEKCAEAFFGRGHTIHEFWSDFDKYPPTPITPYDDWWPW